MQVVTDDTPTTETRTDTTAPADDPDADLVHFNAWLRGLGA